MIEKFRRIPYYGSIALLAYMPFHIFLSQWLSTLTGGLEAWKLSKDCFLAIVTVFAVCLVLWQRRASRLFVLLLGLSVLYALFHIALWATHPDIYRDSALLGLIYNNRLCCFLLLGLSTALLWPERLKQVRWLRVVLGLSTLVALLGVVQWFLPTDFLTHFGYSIERGARPAFLIDDQAGYMRIMSTLREPNVLGAYLIVPIAALAALLCRVKDANKRMVLAGMAGLHGLALLMTQSRSAWLGALLAVGLVLWLQHPAKVRVFAKRFGLYAIALLVLSGAGLFAARNTTFVTSYITHANKNEQVADLDSNDYHIEFIKRGLRGIAHNPLGHGPGTAGLASIQNPAGSFLTENYYIQIGYEIGILGLLVFLALHVVVYRRLWRQKTSTIGAVLLASFWAYVLTNMLLHTWSNEAVAAQWWLLAGIVLGLGDLRNKKIAKERSAA